MKVKGLTNDQIVQEFKKQGITYFPERNAWVKGTYVQLPEGINLKPQSMIADNVATTTSGTDEASSYHKTYYSNYCGYQCSIVPGSMDIEGSGSTHTQYFTTHIGSNGRWLESGVFRMSMHYPQYEYVFTYDPNVDGATVPAYMVASPTQSHTYAISIGPQQTSYGYSYQIFIDGYWVRSDYFPYLYNVVEQNKEVFKPQGVGTYTTDTTAANAFSQQVSYYNGNSVVTQNWNEDLIGGVPSRDGSGYPVQEQSIYDSVSHSVTMRTWVQY